MHYIVKTNLKFQLVISLGNSFFFVYFKPMIFIVNIVGKSFLVDARYTNGPGFLAPYRGTRYHLNEWIGNTSQGYKELFNLCQVSARNAIERLFGILKKR